MSMSKYRELFLAQHQRMLEQYSGLSVTVDGYEKTVYTTWRMCYNLLEQDGDSQRMLWLMAFLHHEDINEGIFERAAINMQTYTPQLPPTEIEASALNYSLLKRLPRAIHKLGWTLGFGAILGRYQQARILFPSRL
jgi:hypothetical protein